MCAIGRAMATARDCASARNRQGLLKRMSWAGRVYSARRMFCFIGLGHLYLIALTSSLLLRHSCFITPRCAIPTLPRVVHVIRAGVRSLLNARFAAFASSHIRRRSHRRSKSDSDCRWHRRAARRNDASNLFRITSLRMPLPYLLIAALPLIEPTREEGF